MEERDFKKLVILVSRNSCSSYRLNSLTSNSGWLEIFRTAMPLALWTAVHLMAASPKTAQIFMILKKIKK